MKMGHMKIMFFYLTGGGGGSRTRVRKCSPLVSTCLVPGLKFRTGYAAGTERTWCYSAKILPTDVQTPSAGQPVESTPQFQPYRQKLVERQYDSY